MTPRDLLQHSDSGALWPPGGGASFVDLAAAYPVALAVRALREARGEKPRGYKIGFTNRSIWTRYQVFAPIWGTVWNTTLGQGDSSGVISLAHLCQPRIEPEVVFGLRATPRPQATLNDLFDELDWVAPGFEIVQSHLPGWKFTAAQTVADGGLHARLWVGQRTAVAELARSAAQLDAVLAGTRVQLQHAGSTVEEGTGAHVLGSPLRALHHFLSELRSCPGATDLSAGDVVTTGTWTDAWPVLPGQTWRAEFDAMLPAIEVRFE